MITGVTSFKTNNVFAGTSCRKIDFNNPNVSIINQSDKDNFKIQKPKQPSFKEWTKKEIGCLVGAGVFLFAMWLISILG